MPTTLDRPRDTSSGAARPARVRRTGLIGVLLVLAVGIVLSVFVGSNPIPVSRVLDVLGGGGGDEARYVVWDQRVPRTVAAIVVGLALGAAGALIQAFTRNPLADPGILGVNAGAAFFVAVGITFFGITDPAGYVWLACLGAFVLTAVVYAVGTARGRPPDPIRLTVSGVAVGAVLSGLTTGLTLTHPDAFDKMRGWNAGSLLERGFDVIVPVLPIVGVGLVLALVAAPGLNSVSLGLDVARAQGVDHRRALVIVLIAVTLLAGGATAIAGPITFVGLMVPHLVRWTLGTDQRIILLGSLLIAPALMLYSDVLGRIAVSPSEMPVGIVTALVGAPVLIALVRRREATAL